MNTLGLSVALKKFITNSDWIFAKTYAKTWPHEYIVQEQVDYDRHTYWHMGNIINRCVVADTFHQRKIDGRLSD